MNHHCHRYVVTLGMPEPDNQGQVIARVVVRVTRRRSRRLARRTR